MKRAVEQRMQKQTIERRRPWYLVQRSREAIFFHRTVARREKKTIVDGVGLGVDHVNFHKSADWRQMARVSGLHVDTNGLRASCLSKYQRYK